MDFIIEINRLFGFGMEEDYYYTSFDNLVIFIFLCILFFWLLSLFPLVRFYGPYSEPASVTIHKIYNVDLTPITDNQQTVQRIFYTMDISYHTPDAVYHSTNEYYRDIPSTVNPASFVQKLENEKLNIFYDPSNPQHFAFTGQNKNLLYEHLMLYTAFPVVLVLYLLYRMKRRVYTEFIDKNKIKITTILAVSRYVLGRAIKVPLIMIFFISSFLLFLHFYEMSQPSSSRSNRELTKNITSFFFPSETVYTATLQTLPPLVPSFDPYSDTLPTPTTYLPTQPPDTSHSSSSSTTMHPSIHPSIHPSMHP